ncbi:MAG: DUF2304 family protein [Candidatus Magasanikbacteria bacterium]|jgi:hypothetical protein
MLLIQILLIIFFFFAIIKVFARYRSGDVAIGAFIFWTALWVGAGVVVWKPDLTMPMARWFGIGRGTDLVVYASIALLFYLFFRLMVKVEKINKNITKIARKIALDDGDLNK